MEISFMGQVYGVICLVIATLLEFASYYKLIAKIRKTGKSAQISSSAFLYKEVKYLVTIAGLIPFFNWAAIVIELAALIFCTVTVYYICANKPKGWTLWGKVKHTRKKHKDVPKHRHTK